MLKDVKIKLDIKEEIATFSFELDKKDFVKVLDQFVDKKIKEVEMDGFRKGKMPKTMFMKKYGYGAILPDAIDDVLNRCINKMVVDNKLQVVGNFEIDWDKLEADPQKGFKVSGKVEIMPQVELKGYKQVKDEITKKEPKVTKKAIKETIDALLQDQAIMEIKEGKAKKGDTVVIDFVGSVDGKEFAGGSSQNYPLELGSNSFIPGFEDQLIGAKEGDNVEVKVTFPKEYHEESLAGKEAIFKTTVHEVKEKKIPKLTDELVKEIKQYDAKTVKELEEKIEEQLKAQQMAQINEEYANEVFEKIKKDNKIKIPKAAIEAQVDSEIKEFENRLTQQGMNLELFLQLTQQDMDTIRKEFEKIAKERVRNSIILDAVMRQEKIKVTTEEYNQYVKDIAKAQDKTQKEIKQQIKDLGIEQQLKENLAVDKAIKLILGE